MFVQVKLRAAVGVVVPTCDTRNAGFGRAAVLIDRLTYLCGYIVSNLLLLLIIGFSCVRPPRGTTINTKAAMSPLQVVSISGLLLTVQPIVVLNYQPLFFCIRCYLLSAGFLLYLLVCYVISMHIVLQFSYRAWYTSKRIRQPIDQHIIYRFKCFLRDLKEGETSMPHMLHYYISVCFFFSAYGSVLSSRFQYLSLIHI